MRVSLRLGAEKVYCIYRRSRAECPARAEEVHHAEQEGVEFNWLTAPVEVLDDGKGNVRAMRCIRMELGEPDDALLSALLVKLFADRQLIVDSGLVDYIAVRMERSLEAANALVDELDREALAAGGAVTRKLAAAALARVFDRQPDDLE